MTDAPLLEMINISKVFPGVRALNKVSISVCPGEVRALVGENGAGKSTLIKILIWGISANRGGNHPARQDGKHDQPSLCAETRGRSGPSGSQPGTLYVDCGEHLYR